MSEGRRRGRPAADDATLTTEAVLDAALEAFAERGYEGTSVREVARALGVSHNLIPQRVGNKETLWFAAVDHGFAALSASLVEVAASAADHDDVATLRALVTGFIAANARRPALVRIIAQEAIADGPRLDHLFARYIGPVRELGADLLARLEAEGRVRTGSVALVYFLMTHGAGGPVALPGLAARFDATVDPTDEVAVQHHAEEMASVIFDGILTA